METVMPYIIDAALAAIVVIAVIRGRNAGFVSSAVSLVGWAAALVSGALLSGPAANWIYTSFLQSRVVQFVSEKTDSAISGLTAGGIELAGGADSLLSGVEDTINTLFSQLGLDIGSVSLGSSDMASSALKSISESGTDAATAIAEAAIEPVVISLLQTLLFLIIFIIVMLIVGLAVKAARVVNNVPLVGGVNRFLGILLGFAKGAILAYVACVALSFIVSVAGERWDWLDSETLKNTVFANYLLNLKINN